MKLLMLRSALRADTHWPPLHSKMNPAATSGSVFPPSTGASEPTAAPAADSFTSAVAAAAPSKKSKKSKLSAAALPLPSPSSETVVAGGYLGQLDSRHVAADNGTGAAASAGALSGEANALSNIVNLVS
jgi:hypothetical protein